ncbi:hypothetical protein GF391_00570 [Candidatus Uhrbacteria bacterium]|nr:hypothetical protein [Candidatus Uhrbacteria bacterium]
MQRTSKTDFQKQREFHESKGFSIHTISAGEARVKWFIGLLPLLGIISLAILLVSCASAADEEREFAANSPIGSGQADSCTVSEVRYPTNARDFGDGNLLYGGRNFLHFANGSNHLGRDPKYASGTPIHPIACGRLVLYRPADGYGTLVAVIEHSLDSPITVQNGDGEDVTISKFLSIYGHGSTYDPKGIGPNLSYSVGQIVQPSDVIMYIQDDDLNGDGPEHLHLGIRVQSQMEAQLTDSKTWFRGNDNEEGDHRKYYTSPATFLPLLARHVGYPLADPPGSGIRQHPIGTLLLDESAGDYWLVVEQGQKLKVTDVSVLPRACAVRAGPEELDCYSETAFHELGMILDATVLKFDGHPEVYRFYPGPGFETTGYQVFLSYESFLSWGYKDTDLQHYPASEKQALLSALPHLGGVGFMPGSLVSAQGQSEVAVANQHGTRRPIIDYDTFLELGYDADCVYQVQESVMDVVAGARVDDVITIHGSEICESGSSSAICTPGQVLPCSCGEMAGEQSCLDDGKSFGPCVCQPGPGGGGDGGSAGSAPECADGEARDCSQYCDPGFVGTQECEQGAWSTSCYCDPETSGTGGSGGTGGASGSGGTGGTGGSSGTGGTAGGSGSSGTGGSGYDLVTVTLTYQGPDWTMPVLQGEWGSRPYGDLTGCTQLASGYAECTFEVPESVLDSMRWQVSLGMTRYWGDTSGLAPAPCVPQNELANYYGTGVTVIGTVSLKLDGVPTEFGLCSNGIANPNYSNICGESPFPYMNGCLNP